MTPDQLLEGLLHGTAPVQRRAMAKAITLLESTRADHRLLADELLTGLLPHAGKSFRLGISGVPGVGKSTFIEALGLYLIGQGHRVAVLAVDPSSTVSGGSISGASSPSFKVTGAVALVSPGASGVDTSSATPTFTWTVYSNADAYELKVFDTLGQQAWTTAIGDKATTTLAYGGPALTAGQFYQWRVVALRRGAPTSQTEELRGLFRVKP